jgi:hypothetical protein
MLKSSLAVLAGIIGGSAVIWLVEALGHALFPVHQLDVNDPGSISEHMQGAPFILLSMVLLAYAAGSFTGGWIAVAISERIAGSVIIGLVLMAFGIFNLLMVPHPLWFTIVSALLYVPMAYWGGRIRARMVLSGTTKKNK